MLRLNTKTKKILAILIFVVVFWFFGLGILIGFLIQKGSLEKMPMLKPEDRILIIAPHIDDEVICCGGLIQQAKSEKTPVTIVYLTNGDDNLYSVIKENLKTAYNPDEFVQLGEQRMNEGKKAGQLLNLEASEQIFLGYPDEGLLPMLSTNFSSDHPFTAQGTRLSFNPYKGTYSSQQSYAGENLIQNLKTIILNFKPTIVITDHQKDKNPDHRAAYLYLEKLLGEINFQTEVFTYLVHYPLFPPQKRLAKDQYLYPPRRLFSPSGWYSFELTDNQENNKLAAIQQNHSQAVSPRFYDLVSSFVKRNELFEKVD